MALTKVTGKGITCSAVTEDKLGTSAVTTNKIGPDAVTSAKIDNGAVTADDLASTLDLSSKTVTLASDLVTDLKRPVQDNIALLGFKMAVNDGLTVFNLVDGVVDEFNDESGTDEAEGSNDTYCATSDFYTNTRCEPASVPYSAGFASNSITEPDTSTNGGDKVDKTFTVPCGMTSLTVHAWGAGGGPGVATWASPACGYAPCQGASAGGGGGYTTGTKSVSASDVLYISIGEGGKQADSPGSPVAPVSIAGSPASYFPNPSGSAHIGGGVIKGTDTQRSQGGAGGGLTMVSTSEIAAPYPAISVPAILTIAGSGGGGACGPADWPHSGGAGGGLTGQTGVNRAGCVSAGAAQTSSVSYTYAGPNGFGGGGGGQSGGGQANTSGSESVSPGAYLEGGDSIQPNTPGYNSGAGGAGYYGGGAGGQYGSGGGGSSYIGNPTFTSSSTEGNDGRFAGNTGPNYQPCTAEVSFVGPTFGPNYVDPTTGPTGEQYKGEDGYVLITGTGCGFSTVTASTTIVSDTFTSTSVATSARIVVFEENVDTPTLNTDIIASVSRDGTNFTNATLTDSGYVTGSSGQRILTGQADISGQPSGQSMRWKLALANNQVKIHGVALQWS